MNHLDILIQVTKLARVCGKEHVSLKEGADRAKRVLESQEELGRLCQEAYNRILELNYLVTQLKYKK